MIGYSQVISFLNKLHIIREAKRRAKSMGYYGKDVITDEIRLGYITQALEDLLLMMICLDLIVDRLEILD